MKRNIGVAVIDGGYGDGGKGLMTDYWARQLDNPVVIRFNGGAQAGHTVQTPDGRRNVFSHFGSGSFAKAPTYLSRFFVVNPILFRQEHEEFRKAFGFAPEISIDPNCHVTTPVEMIINQLLETQRGITRHGSCGVGFGETFERIKRTHLIFELHYMMGISYKTLYEDIRLLLEKYFPTRINVDSLSEQQLEAINHSRLVDDYWDSLTYMADWIDMSPSTHIVPHRDIIFEGAQGLELDQDYGAFPYVTRSNCGMRNVTTLIEELVLNFQHFLVNYVTRAYKTRHGAGPFPGEIHEPFPYEDRTNVHNDWQGSLRWGRFDYGNYRSITDKDFALYGNQHNMYYSVERVDTMTCMDQLNFEQRGGMEQSMRSAFTYYSYGPTHEDVKEVKHIT